MSELENMPGPDNNESPFVPGKSPGTFLRKVYNFLSSKKLAMGLLLAILACCLTGVTFLRGKSAYDLIFKTLWFNGLLILLVVNVGFCFFGRMRGRKMTLIFFGMVLFHLSFITILGGIIYNSLFFFEGTIRLSEGETLPSGNLDSYDYSNRGRFFDLSKLKGETTLLKMHAGYKVDGTDKRAAYEISVGDARSQKQGIIYITHNLDHNGFKYLPDREGYSIVTALYDKQGQDIYDACIPLQSLRQNDKSYLYVTGTKEAPGSFVFPQRPEKPLFDLQVAYRPSPATERAGNVFFQAWPLANADPEKSAKTLSEVKANIGEKIKVGDYFLSATEVRYWVAMKVRSDPGKPIVLTSLWVALIGMVLTTIGRMVKGGRK